MAAPYRLFGMEYSPYSVKVRSYLRYKGIPHEWIVRSARTMAEYQKYAKIPIIPLLVTPADEGLQDSTPIIERLEALHPEPSIHPADPVAAFVSVLLEEFGDEWGNKWMFHYRWARPVDQDATAEALARAMMPDLDEAELRSTASGVKERMVGRVWFVGSSEQTAPLIEQSFQDGIAGLEPHLSERPYLFGGRPALGDLGLWGQIYNASLDPTAGGILRERAPAVMRWVERMLEPTAEGAFEPWSALEPTLLPFLAEHVGAVFLPWSDANARCLAAGEEAFEVELPIGRFGQKPQKYHAKSLAALRAKYAEAAGEPLDGVLEKAGCRRWLAA